LKPKDLTGRQLILRARRDPGLLRRFIQEADVIGRSCQKLGLTMSNGDAALQLSQCSSSEFFAWTK